MATSNPQLVKAYELIKAGQLTEAGNILKSYLASQPNDPNGWWLMAHAVSKPEAVQKCLEKVLKLDPGHTRARDKLARLQAQKTPAYEFVMPDDLAPEAPPAERERFDWGGLVAGRLGSDEGSFTSSRDIFGSPGRGLDLPEPSKKDRSRSHMPPVSRGPRTSTMIGIGLIVIAVVVLGGLLAYKASEEGWIGNKKDPVPGVIATNSYTMTYPVNWMSECSSGFLWMQEVCAFSNDKQYSMLDLYTKGRDDIGSDSLLDSVDFMLFEGGHERPSMVVTGVVLDYPLSGGDYKYIRQSILWYEELYKSWLGRTNYIQGYDLYMRYERQNPVIHGETSYIYWISGKDAVGAVLSGRGYFLICDAFIPHGDRMLMMELVAYSSTSLEDIPRQEIQNMLDTVVFGG